MPAIGARGPMPALPKAPAPKAPVASRAPLPGMAALGAAKTRAASPPAIPTHQTTVTRVSQTGRPSPQAVRQGLTGTPNVSARPPARNASGPLGRLVAKLATQRPGVNYRYSPPQAGGPPNGLLVPYIRGNAPDFAHPAIPSTPLIPPVEIPSVPSSFGIAPGGGIVKLVGSAPDRLPPHVAFGVKEHLKREGEIPLARVGEWKPRPMQTWRPNQRPRLGQWDGPAGSLRLT